jgi:phosphatidate phosphatase PAH1
MFCFQSLQDQNGFSLPRGPLFMSPLSFTPAVMEALTDPSSTKSTTLRQLIDLFDRKQVHYTLIITCSYFKKYDLQNQLTCKIFKKKTIQVQSLDVGLIES